MLMEGYMGKYVKCPRCELNWILEENEYCDVCKAELGVEGFTALFVGSGRRIGFETSAIFLFAFTISAHSFAVFYIIYAAYIYYTIKIKYILLVVINS